MKLVNSFVEDISQSVRFVQLESDKELNDELTALTSGITRTHYLSWVLETFVVGINALFSKAVEVFGADADHLNSFKEALYEAVLNLNPKVDPSNIYIGKASNLTLDKGLIKLVNCKSWDLKEDPSSLMVLHNVDYQAISDQATQSDHFVEVSPWELIPEVLVCIRKFDEAVKLDLLYGHNPKTEDDIKYIVVAICIDNFPSLYNHISYSPAVDALPFHKVIYSLYNIAIEYNPFLKLTLEDFETTNRNHTVYKAAAGSEEKEANKKARKSLQEVPLDEILALEDGVNERVFGHQETIAEICKSIKRAHIGLKNPNAPIGSFYFYGGTSTGKTELAKVFAQLLTKSNNGLIKIPCNTLLSSHNLHTLMGAPPGYVGYEEKGLLEKNLEHVPFKVLLFDEVEKASSKVFEIVLEMLEEGQCLVASGKVINMRECLIIFTSNLGQSEASKATNTVGFSSSSVEDQEKESIERSTFEKTLKDTLKPEFLARLNGVYYFKRLSDADLLKTAKKQLEVYIKILKEKGIKLQLSGNLSSYILKKCKETNLKCHARDIKNFIDLNIVPFIGDYLIKLGDGGPGKKGFKLDIKDSVLNIKPK